MYILTQLNVCTGKTMICKVKTLHLNTVPLLPREESCTHDPVEPHLM